MCVCQCVCVSVCPAWNSWSLTWPRVCLGVLLLAGNWKSFSLFFFLSSGTVHADRQEDCELWITVFYICSRSWIHFHLFGGKISRTPGKTSSGSAGKRVWHLAREENDPACMLGVMTKNNGIVPHNQGSSIMISTASTMTVLYVGVKLDVSATDCKIALQRNKKKNKKEKHRQPNKHSLTR